MWHLKNLCRNGPRPPEKRPREKDAVGIGYLIDADGIGNLNILCHDDVLNMAFGLQ